MNMAVMDLTGQHFGRLTVIEQYGFTKHGNATWLCRCDCGNTKVVVAGEIRRGNVKSCGCYARELSRKRAKKHGGSGTRLYRAWKNMLHRCFDETDKRFSRYGERGITVCQEWLGENGYNNFRSWALSNGYADNLTIDRIDNDGIYSPDNCRWVTVEEQANNRSNNHRITYQNKTQTLAQWADEVGIAQDTIRYRISHYNWSVEKALTTPVRGNPHRGTENRF